MAADFERNSKRVEVDMVTDSWIPVSILCLVLICSLILGYISKYVKKEHGLWLEVVLNRKRFCFEDLQDDYRKEVEAGHVAHLEYKKLEAELAKVDSSIAGEIRKRELSDRMDRVKYAVNLSFLHNLRCKYRAMEFARKKELSEKAAQEAERQAKEDKENRLNYLANECEVLYSRAEKQEWRDGKGYCSDKEAVVTERRLVRDRNGKIHLVSFEKFCDVDEYGKFVVFSREDLNRRYSEWPTIMPMTIENIKFETDALSQLRDEELTALRQLNVA